ncbi:hypothetical protein OG911_28195 [Streptomyces sp. NBC_00208]|uniref:hypothetical protein n=1 Tax=Streptomyces sp. NBC_00208 TaxID=2975681 RepID=UPI002E2B568C|nr:hypothetical protein [Streptomyces sp. NBC_00208]
MNHKLIATAPSPGELAAGLAAEERHQCDPMDATIAQLACTCRTTAPKDTDYPEWAAWLAQQIAKSDATRRNR